MDTLTRRRLVVIGLALSGPAGLSRLGWAQTKEVTKELPDCPRQSGIVGDWQWTSFTFGTSLRATVIKIVERGDFVGEPSHNFLHLTGSKWEFHINLSRQPAGNNVVISVAGGGKWATASVPRTTFKTSRGQWSAIIDLAPVLRPGLVDPAQSTEIALELIDGTKTVCKFVVGSRGFTQALAKGNAEVKPLRAMLDSKACKEPNCYLTSLCVEQIGLSDDCFELETLRAYRDGALRTVPGGEDLIAEYYREAPLIVAEMQRRGEEWRMLRFYLTHVLPCVVFARLGLDWLTLWRYRQMMRLLQRRYGTAPKAPAISVIDSRVELVSMSWTR